MSFDDLEQAIQSPTIRIELAPTMNFTQGTIVETARISVLQGNGRWKKVQPLLLPRDGEGRAELLEDLAKIMRGEVERGEEVFEWRSND